MTNDSLPELLPANLGIDGEKIDSCLKGIRSEVLLPVARVFLRNAEDISWLLSLPLVLMYRGMAKASEEKHFMLALLRTHNVHKFKDSEEARREVFDEAERLRGKMFDTDVGNNFERATHELQWLFSSEEKVRSSVRSLLSAAAAAGWTSFEVLATDMWVAALNARPLPLGSTALNAIPQDATDESLNSKRVSVSLLEKYDYDLRGSLGDLLRAKFDFTGVSSIEKAYSAAFGKSAGLDHVFDRADDINLLECVRHLIVHRAGIVDEEFLKRTGFAAPVGERFALDSPLVHKLVNAAIDSGCDLIQFVDMWMSSNRAGENAEIKQLEPKQHPEEPGQPTA